MLVRTCDEETFSDLRRIVGDIDDMRLAAILALDPNREEIEEAVEWADGYASLGGHENWPLSGKVGAIFDILTGDLEDPTIH